MTTHKSLQDSLDEAGAPTKLLTRPLPSMASMMPYPAAHSDWREEQKAWKSTAVLFDQSYHMTDLYITGPDRLDLVKNTAVNSFANFGANRAKQYVATTEHGFIVGDGILFCLSEDELCYVGSSTVANWIQYQAEVGKYDVDFVREERGATDPVPKRYYRYEIQGPTAWKVVERAHGGPIDRIKFFHLGEFTIGDLSVRAFNHTMAGVPGDESTGVELFGPKAEEEQFLAAVLEAGQEFGLVRGGALSYLSTAAESGWIPIPMPAIYTDDLKGYRQILDQDSEEAWITISGSFRSDRIEDYYVTPWDLGYGHIVKFDHDFVGRAALENMATEPQRKKVWLTWNRDDTVRAIASSMLDGDDRARPLDGVCQMGTYDQVRSGDGTLVGLAVLHGFTVNLGGWVSLASVDGEAAVDGNQVEILWGDPDGGASSPYVATHQQTKIRATVSTKSPIA